MQIQAPKVNPATGVLFRASCFIFMLAFLLNEVNNCPQASLFWAQIIRRAKLGFSVLNPAGPSERCLALNDKHCLLMWSGRGRPCGRCASGVEVARGSRGPERCARLTEAPLPPGPSWR